MVGSASSGSGRRVPPPPPPQKISGKIWHKFSSDMETVIKRRSRGDARRLNRPRRRGLG
jgi:hypothetical protein